MKYDFIMILLGIIFLYGCNNQATTSSPEKEETYSRWIGDINYDPAIDRSNFQLCHDDSLALQYFNFGEGLQYDGEKKAILNEFAKKYKPKNDEDASGIIRIRFLVNCNGESGRYRIISSDDNYREKLFDEEITNQLLSISKQLSGWKTLSIEGTERDYYQYLIFKMQKGKIVEILP